MEKKVTISEGYHVIAETDFQGVEELIIEGDADVSILPRSDYMKVYVHDEATLDVGGCPNIMVEAYEEAYVEAEGDICVKAFENSKVKARRTCMIYAFESATVEAYDKCCVTAYGESCARVHDECFVIARDYAEIIAYDRVSVRVHDEADIVESDPTADIRYIT